MGLGALEGFSLSGAAAGPDGRGIEARQDFIVLAPYQHLWFSGGLADRGTASRRVAASEK